MSSPAQKILDQALSLPEEEREALIDALTESLDQSHEALSDEWKAEISRRIDSVERGDSALVEGDEVLARLRAALRRAG